MNKKQFHKLLQIASLKRLFRTPIFIVYIICICLISFNLINTYHLRPFTSDDVFWQSILQSWHPFNGTTVTLGNSSIYIDKIPFYEFFNHFFGSSRRVLFAESAIEMISSFTAFYCAAVYFLKKSKAKLNYATLLPFIWLSSFGYEFIFLYLNPNWRGFQLGISFAYFAMTAGLIAGDIKVRSILSKLLFVLVSVYAGLQIYSDPYFLYFTVAPIILLLIVLFAAKVMARSRLKWVACAVILSLIFAKVFSYISIHAGINTSINDSMQFVQFNTIPTNIVGSLNSILVIFSADFFGLKIASLPTLVALLNFILLIYVSCSSYSFLKRIRHITLEELSFDKIWQSFFACAVVLVFISYATSTLSDGTATYRYFLMLVLLLVMLLTMKLGSTTNAFLRNVMVIILIGASILNLAYTEFGSGNKLRPGVVDNRANYQNYLLIKAVINKGYSKGYANYWQGDINTYLSKGKVSFLPSLCAGSETEKFHWLINNAAFKKPAPKTFYLEDPDIVAPATCDISQIVAQFGPPASTEEVGDKTILFYNYDISSKIPNFVF